MSLRGDENYVNKYPDDAEEIAKLVRAADLPKAIRLLQVWGSQQRDHGALKAIEMVRDKIDAQA